MSSRHEAIERSDERAPLLAQPRLRQNLQTLPRGDELSPETDQTPWTFWRLAWNGFWAVLIIVLITLFVKGWIDADDVEVK